MKYQLGRKEIIACISGAFLFVIAALIVDMFFPFGMTSGYGDYFNVSISILAVFSAIFGPVVGAVVGFGGAMISDIMLAGEVYLMDALAACLYGVLIGLLHEKFMVLDGDFGISQIPEYVAATVFAGISNWVMLCPMVSCIYGRSNLYLTLRRGFKVFVGSSIGAIVLGVTAMIITSKVIYSRKQRYVYRRREL